MTKSKDRFTECLMAYATFACLSVALAVCVVAWLGYAKPAPKETAEPESLPKPEPRVEESDYGVFLKLLAAARRKDNAGLEYLASQLGNPRPLSMPLETSATPRIAVNGYSLLNPHAGYPPKSARRSPRCF